MKCCDKCNIVEQINFMKVDSFHFPYRLTYCSNCGKVKATTNIRDGIKEN